MLACLYLAASSNRSSRERDLAVEQVVQRVLEGAGQQLRFKVDGQKPRAGIDVLAAGHLGLVQYRPLGLATGVPERQTRGMDFLQRRKAARPLPHQCQPRTVIPRLRQIYSRSSGTRLS